MYSNLTLKERKKLLSDFLKETGETILDVKTNNELNRIIDMIPILLKNYKDCKNA